MVWIFLPHFSFHTRFLCLCYFGRGIDAATKFFWRFVLYFLFDSFRSRFLGLFPDLILCLSLPNRGLRKREKRRERERKRGKREKEKKRKRRKEKREKRKKEMKVVTCMWRPDCELTERSLHACDDRRCLRRCFEGKVVTCMTCLLVYSRHNCKLRVLRQSRL